MMFKIERLAIFGLGYVGCVSAACLTQNGVRVVGVDKNSFKVKQLKAGRTPIVEPKVAQMLASALKNKLLTAVTGAAAAVNITDAALICVGTPSLEDGHLNISYVLRVTEEIAEALCRRKGAYILIYRSTLEPGTMDAHILPLLKKILGDRLDHDVHVVYQPEFLREGVAVNDYYDPGKTVVGASCAPAADAVLALYHGKTGPVFRTDFKTAEMVKVVDNVYHALKIAFGNEVGVMCRRLGMDARRLMDIFIADTRLNISPKYFSPGKPFGGSCLPKELRCVKRSSMELNLSLPVINNILESNELRKEEVSSLIMRLGKKKVGFIGLSFKEGTDDLRESPCIDWVEKLLGKGFDVRVYDPQVNYARLMGANKEYLDKHIPHITRLLASDLKTLVKHSEVVVVANRQDGVEQLGRLLGKSRVVVDLVGLDELRGRNDIRYHGLFWPHGESKNSSQTMV